jgi:hypothetical protein
MAPSESWKKKAWFQEESCIAIKIATFVMVRYSQWSEESFLHASNNVTLHASAKAGARALPLALVLLIR